MKKLLLLALCLLIVPSLFAQDRYPDTTVVRPVEIDDVLNNPGIGFMTFQRFNGDTLNAGSGWTEGFPIEYQEFDGDLTNPDHPATTLAYHRVYWKFLEPDADDEYNWELVDKALKTAAERGQTLILRIAPYGTGPERDVPSWYRELVGPEKPDSLKESVRWRVRANDPRYVKYYTDMVRDLGSRYNGHPDLELVDLSIVGFWGEGGGSRDMTQETREALVGAYIDAFPDTYLSMLLTDEKTNKYGLSRANVGWRVDCIGDLNFWAKDQGGWTHMYDYYPRGIIEFGMEDAWKKAPISLEICGTLRSWKKRGYGLKEVRYIFDQSLKWHISSFNAKSSPVPPEWWPEVNRWLNKMGYRYVLRRISYPDKVRPHGKLGFRTWWENKGVAPIYREFTLALRLVGKTRTEVFRLGEDMREWLPGDIIWDDAVSLPHDMPEGSYDLQIAVLNPRTLKPAVKLAIEGITDDGWYSLGTIEVEEDSLK